MVSSAEALSNAGRKFLIGDSENRYVRRVTMTSRDAVVREEPRAAEVDIVKPAWLREAASRLVEFTRLPHDWDLEGGDAIDPSAARIAFALLSRLASNMSVAPDLVPVGDGAVMVEWHTPSVDLEIEVGPDFEGSVFIRDRVTNRQFHSTRFKSVFNSLSRLNAYLEPSDR
jgi:hypothetical protein